MKLTREELAIAQTALAFQEVALNKYPVDSTTLNAVTTLRRKIQSHLLSDDCPTTVRSPKSEPADGVLAVARATFTLPD